MKNCAVLTVLAGIAAAAAARQYAEGGVETSLKKWPPPADRALIGAPYLNPSLELEERVEDLFNRLTDEEKAEIIHGASGYTYGKMPRIGLAEFIMADGPQGVRRGGTETATSYPCGIAMAAAWNPDAVNRIGSAIAEECKATNTRVILGPGVNIMRTPLGGRTFEYFGEDPYLAGMTAAGYIAGVQKEGIAACIKHWLLNDQEWARTCIDVDVSERALREIYARPYEIAIREANPWAVMASYNRVRGEWATHNRRLNDMLYKDFDYDGAVISDWGAWRGDRESINGGCSLCMPSGKNGARNESIAKAVKNGNISETFFNDAVRRNIRFALRVGAFNRADEGGVNTAAQAAAARKLAEESMVLLKNTGILPIDPASVKKVALIGPNADEFHTMIDGRGVHDGKGGAGATRPEYEITPLQAAVAVFGKENVIYAPGPRFREPKKVSFPDMPLRDPLEAAAEADLVVFCAGIDHSLDRERAGWDIYPDSDKPALELPAGQAGLIQKVAAANHRTVVVLINGSPVSVEPWHETVPAILEAWYGGQDAGNTVFDILTGKVNPSGKLPVTFGRRLLDWPAHALGAICYPGLQAGRNAARQFYSDHIWVGYRGFDALGIAPRYPFGFGLSYTAFTIEPVSPGYGVRVTNTGSREGAEVVQCYLSKPSPAATVPMPVRELIGFKKVNLKPGESETVSFKIADDAMKYWSETVNAWEIAKGTYTVSIGTSSRDLPASFTFTR